MNDIEFTHYPWDEKPAVPVVGLRVDGIDLRVLAADATAPLWALEVDDDDFDSDAERDWFPLDAHDGLFADEVAPPSRHFLGEPGPRHRYDGPGEVPLLGCPCGIWSCWPLLARITVAGDTVTWSDFRQPCRPQWGVLPLGPFTFDRATYLERLAAPVILSDRPSLVRSRTSLVRGRPGPAPTAARTPRP